MPPEYDPFVRQQLGNVRRDPPRLIAREQLGHQARQI
jgi:hypothetical protein